MFYLVSIISFLLLPLVIVILLISPYLPLLHFLEYYFYLIKPYGIQIFQTKESMWSSIGILSAVLGVFLGIIYQEFKKKKQEKQVIISFKDEIRNNINQLFTGDVERTYYYDCYESIRQNYQDRIRNYKEFQKITDLYNELKFFQELVKLWRINCPTLITEKHYKTCNVFCAYFNNRFDDKKFFNKLSEYTELEWNHSREMVIDIKNKKFNKWIIKLDKNISKIFY